MTRWFLPVAFIASAVWATTMIAMDVPTLTRASDLVVRGTVVKREARWTSDGQRIMTDTELEIAEVLKGNAVVGRSIVLMQPGGEVGDIGQRVHGVATFRVGEEVVVFLERRGEKAFVVGLAQGRLLVDRSGATPMVRGGEETLFLLDAKTHQPVPNPVQPMSLDELKRVVAQSLGPAVEPTRPTRPGVTVP